MKLFQFRPDAADQIARAGIVQADVARGADYDRYEFNKRVNRAGRMRPASAHRVAAAFANLARIDHDQALQLLFDEIER